MIEERQLPVQLRGEVRQEPVEVLMHEVGLDLPKELLEARPLLKRIVDGFKVGQQSVHLAVDLSRRFRAPLHKLNDDTSEVRVETCREHRESNSEPVLSNSVWLGRLERPHAEDSQGKFPAQVIPAEEKAKSSHKLYR